MTPPEVDGLPEDGHQVVPERVHRRLAAGGFRHVTVRYRYVTVKVRGSDRPVSAPAREGVSRSGRADVSLLAGMPVDRFMWRLPLHRRHRMPADTGITVSRGSPILWANRAISLPGPVHDAQWRSVPGAPSSRWTGRRSGPVGIRESRAACGRAISGRCPATAAGPCRRSRTPAGTGTRRGSPETAAEPL